VEEGTASSAVVAAPREIFRNDYRPLPYAVSNVSMNFDIRDGKTIVESVLTVVRKVGIALGGKS
jgi:aminopeptidase N